MVEDKNICIMSLFNLNKEIREGYYSPTGFSYPRFDEDRGDVYSLMGSYGDWEVSTRSDQQSLIFNCPIIGGTFQNSLASTNVSLENSWIQIKYELDDIEAYFNMLASLVPAPDQPEVVVIDSSYNFSSEADPSRIERECNRLFEKIFSSESGDLVVHILSMLIPDPKLRGDKKIFLQISLDKNNDEETDLQKSMISMSYK
ncbi:hypothetical protein V1503_24665 [Bacillus sp. SCS-151]|uniref:hypothetical protein n=1 Tax=Nanhaiella sioensis TaxID=3115293 RepID=UPI00397D1477